MNIIENDILLRIKNLNTGYENRQVLFDVSFFIVRGEIVLLVGGNGSGKSTLLKSIYGLLPVGKNGSLKWWQDSVVPVSLPNKCSVVFNNENITRASSNTLIKKGLVYVPQKNNSFEQLTVNNNLEVVASYLKEKEIKDRTATIYDKLPALKNLRNKTSFQLSGGEKLLLALGMALMHRPQMIMLDEPAAGLTPSAWRKNIEIINALNQTGVTFLIVEHRLRETIGKADRIIGLKLGKITLNEFTKSENLDQNLQEVFI